MPCRQVTTSLSIQLTTPLSWAAITLPLLTWTFLVFKAPVVHILHATHALHKAADRVLVAELAAATLVALWAETQVISEHLQYKHKLGRLQAILWNQTDKLPQQNRQQCYAAGVPDSRCRRIEAAPTEAGWDRVMSLGGGQSRPTPAQNRQQCYAAGARRARRDTQLARWTQCRYSAGRPRQGGLWQGGPRQGGIE